MLLPVPPPPELGPYVLYTQTDLFLSNHLKLNRTCSRYAVFLSLLPSPAPLSLPLCCRGRFLHHVRRNVALAVIYRYMVPTKLAISPLQTLWSMVISACTLKQIQILVFMCTGICSLYPIFYIYWFRYPSVLSTEYSINCLEAYNLATFWYSYLFLYIQYMPVTVPVFPRYTWFPRKYRYFLLLYNLIKRKENKIRCFSAFRYRYQY